MVKINEIKMCNRVGVLPLCLFNDQVTTSMKFLKIILFILIAMTAFTGCQEEADETILPIPAEAFTANSAEADFIKRTTLRDGSSDNILDSASCVTLSFPVTVIVNGEQIIVSTEDDLKYVERILDEADDDEDEVNIVFPVTVVLADHTEIVVENEDAFEDLMEDCIEGGDDDDIECIDFVFPVKLTVYNTNTQVSEVVTLNNDAQLYDFIESLEDDELVSFKFPVVMQLADGTEITLNDNEALEGAIEDSSDDCDEDDDNDFDDDDIDDSNLVTTLLSGSWEVDYFFDEADETSEFANFTFTFYADGTALATNGVTEVEGTWATYGDDGELELDLDFGEDSPFDEIMEDWGVFEFDDTEIVLKDDLDEGEPVKTLIFKKQ
jgi:hypothetical protein